MIEQIKHIEDLNALHWVLAYTGLIVHVIMKVANIKGDLSEGLTRRFMLTTLASFFMIPVLLLICTEGSLKEMLPINYLTSFLAGYQTQSIITNIGTFTKKTVTEGGEN
jgi:hypothetical protein